MFNCKAILALYNDIEHFTQNILINDMEIRSSLFYRKNLSALLEVNKMQSTVPTIYLPEWDENIGSSLQVKSNNVW